MTKSEADLKDILCRVRSTDWEASVRRATDIWSDSSAGRGWYKDFMSKGDFTNVWSKRLDEHLRRPVEWERMTFSDICMEIQKAPQEVKQSLQILLDRYWMAAQALHRDVVPDKKYLHASTLTEVTTADIPDDDEARFCLWWNFLGDNEKREMDDVDEKSIVMRMLAIQELKKRLFTAPGAQADQDGKPAADRQDVGPIKWRGEQDGFRALEALAEHLHERGWIKSSQWFVERFGSACPPDEDGWDGADNLLVYLLEQLQDRKKFVRVSRPTLETVFRVKYYKQKKRGYENNDSGKPKVADEIDRILSVVFPDS